MKITAATFFDPKMRPQLQSYYDNKKTEFEKITLAQKNEPIREIKVVLPDGTEQKGTISNFTPAFIPFNKWLEFSAQSMIESDSGPLSIKAAQQNIDNVKQNSPDDSSNVKKTFSNHETLLAYIDSDGGLVAHDSSGLDSSKLTHKADALGLSGAKRMDYLSSEIETSISSRFPDFKVTTYTDTNILSKREFSQMWYPNHDVDADYKIAMNEAIDMLKKAQSSHFQSENNIYEIQEFILKVQEGRA